MKQNKRRTATVVYIFIFMLTVSGCVRKGKEQDKVYQETGMFEWKLFVNRRRHFTLQKSLELPSGIRRQME